MTTVFAQWGASRSSDQKQIAHEIVAPQGDAVLARKGHQGNLHEAVKQWFELALAQQCKGIEHESHATFDRGHGRWEPSSGQA